MNINSKLFKKLFAILALTCTLVACSNSTNKAQGTSEGEPSNKTYSDTVSISQISTIPTVSGVKSGQTFYVVAFNDTAERINLSDMKVLNSVKVKNLGSFEI